jgi:hypothetical protein
MRAAHPELAHDGHRTLDGRYFVVRGRLWRATKPDLDDEVRDKWIKALMAARRRLRRANSQDERVRQQARRDVQRAKVALGERGPVWWNDGAPDYGRRLVVNTPYAEWYERAVLWQHLIERLLDSRASNGSICPSEVARASGAPNWRAHLDEVRHVARHLASRSLIEITQRGRRIPEGSAVRGPIRLRRAQRG